MREKTSLTPESIFGEVSKGREFNAHIKLADTVEKNEYFYNDDQWHGLETTRIMKPVFNFLQRVVKFFISSVVSDDIGVSVNEFDENETTRPVMDMLGAQFDEIMEADRFKKKTREIIRDAAVDGDGVLHHYFDTDVPARTVDGMKGTAGAIKYEIVQNTKIYFGNPQNPDVQTQPYILLEFRRVVEDVKEMARQNGGKADDIEEDEDAERRETTPDTGKVTVVRRYWKQRGEDGQKTVWAMEVTETAVVRPAWDTGYSLYPVTVMQWEKVKNNFHGKAALTGYIQNQIFVNKAFAMVMKHLENMAFPKVIYNKSLIQKWDNGVGSAIGVSGDPNFAIASSYKAQDMSSQVLQTIQLVLQFSRDMMGASDAALGNIVPDNTSAIIATQKATSMPLELQKQDFYSFVEDCVRIWLDMMTVNYGVRPVRIKVKAPEMPQMPGLDALAQMGGAGMPPNMGAATGAEQPQLPEQQSGLPPMDADMPLDAAAMQQAGGAMPLDPAAQMGAGMPNMGTMPGMAQPPQQPEETEEVQIINYDFTQLKNKQLHLNVDIGAATYWSELMQAQTLDAMFANKVITDPVTYLENVPRGYVPNRNDILAAVKKEQEDLKQAAVDSAQAEALQQGGIAL